MKYLVKILSGFIAIQFLSACGGSSGGFEDPAAAAAAAASNTVSQSGIINAKNFSIGFDEFDSDVIKFGAEPTITARGIVTLAADPIVSRHGSVEVEVIVTAGDYDNIKVTSGTVFFKTQYGLLSATSCEIGETGQCSVTWSSLTNIDVLYDDPATPTTVDVYNDITAWTYGEEHFIDGNNPAGTNDVYDDTEANNVFTDIPEPYVDFNTDSTFDAGEDIFDIDSNNIHTVADGQYNGPNCNRSDAICAGATLIPIFATGRIDLSFE